MSIRTAVDPQMPMHRAIASGAGNVRCMLLQARTALRWAGEFCGAVFARLGRRARRWARRRRYRTRVVPVSRGWIPEIEGIPMTDDMALRLLRWLYQPDPATLASMTVVARDVDVRLERATRLRLAGANADSASLFRDVARQALAFDPMGPVMQCALHGWGSTLLRLGEIDWACRLQIAALGMRCHQYGPGNSFTRRTAGMLIASLVNGGGRGDLLAAVLDWYDRDRNTRAVLLIEQAGLLPAGEWPDVAAALIRDAPCEPLRAHAATVAT
jgi:hypothetical protein